MAGPLVCALVAALLLVTLGWHGVIGGLVGLVVGLLVGGGARRAQRDR